MELVFNKEGNKWVAEFEAPSDFNLHIEREQVAYINIMQRGSSNGEYDLAKSFSADKTFDYDFGALVYPKWIKVVSGSEVVSASVNFNEGGGSGSESEDNNQNIIYIDIQHPIGSTQDYWILRNLPYALYIKFYDVDGNICIGFPYWVGNNVGNNIIAIAIDLSAKISPDGKEFISVEEFIQTDVLTNFPRLTKEEFYNLDA